MRAVVLSASTGNGHMSAAYAIDAVLKDRGHRVKTVDALKYAPSAFRLWYAGGYEMVVRRSPRAWGQLYKVSDAVNLPYKLQTRMDFEFLASLRKLIAEERPEWVICTHSLPQPRLEELRKEFGFRMAIVVTDLYPHLMWLRGAPDWFFVPSEWSREVLDRREQGLAERTTVTGIPIHPVFGVPVSRSEADRVVGRTADVPMVTMTSGGIGGGPLTQALHALMGLGRPLHLEVICGRNEQRRRDIENRVRKQAYNSPVQVRVRGHITQHEMAVRMQHSEFLISKPGGLTTSECLATGCPMLVFHPFLIPGQEEGNAEFLVQEQAGVEARTTAELLTVVRELLAAPDRLAAMRAKARLLGKPDAARDIVRALEAMH